jgi:hypothetical protein
MPSSFATPPASPATLGAGNAYEWRRLRGSLDAGVFFPAPAMALFSVLGPDMKAPQFKNLGRRPLHPDSKHAQ